MASSSDWLAAITRDAAAMDTAAMGAAPHGWMAQLGESGGFVEGLPYGGAVTTLDRRDRRDPLDDGAAAPEQAVPEHDPVAEAFARGEAAGRAAAAEEHDHQAQRQRALRLSFRAFDQAAMDCLASELAETVVALCSQALADFATDPEALLERCSQAARRLGMGPGECSLHLHPDDIALIDPAMLEAWQVVPDAGVEHGGLRLEGADGSVSDGPPDWRRAIAAAIRG